MWRWIYSLQQVRKPNNRWPIYYCTFIPNKTLMRVKIFFDLSFQGHHVILKVPNITPIVAYYPQWLYSCFLGTFNVQPYSLLIYYQIQSWDYSLIWLDVVQKQLNPWSKCLGQLIFRIHHLLKLVVTLLAFGVLGYFIIDYTPKEQSFNIFTTEYFGYDEIFDEVSDLFEC